jgi:hypothetical protein
LWYRVWTLDLMITYQVLYHLSYTLNLFCFSYFWDRISYFYWGWLWSAILLPTPLM